MSRSETTLWVFVSVSQSVCNDMVVLLFNTSSLRLLFTFPFFYLLPLPPLHLTNHLPFSSHSPPLHFPFTSFSPSHPITSNSLPLHLPFLTSSLPIHLLFTCPSLSSSFHFPNSLPLHLPFPSSSLPIHLLFNYP